MQGQESVLGVAVSPNPHADTTPGKRGNRTRVRLADLPGVWKLIEHSQPFEWHFRAIRSDVAPRGLQGEVIESVDPVFV